MNRRIINLAGEDIEFSVDDRGLNYGDGVFETLLVHRGKPVWWSEHWQRLLIGAKALSLPEPNEALVQNACEQLIETMPACVLKIVLTRGSGGRGYVMPKAMSPRIIISLHAVPEKLKGPLRLTDCNTRLSHQIKLAGIKHLNRLEQVLARNEWQDDSIFDGVMCDLDNQVICTTSANIFAKINGRWLTPKIMHCGIAGIARSWVLKQWPQVQEAHLSRTELDRAEAIFICNAVRGILAVDRLGGRALLIDQDIMHLQQQLAAAEPAFAGAAQ